VDKNYEIISGIREVHHGVHRNDLTIDQHLAKEWNGDIGKPMCVYKIKKMIVIMRRSKKISGVQFCDYLNAHREPVLHGLNQRWLISICDTIADYSTGERRIHATWIGTLFKRTMIQDSFLHHATDWELNQNNILNKMPLIDDSRFAEPLEIPGLDGAVTVTNTQTDLVDNITIRITNVLKEDPLMFDIYQKLLELHKNSDSIYGLWNKLKHEG
tara:strand:+ start:6962 stop:7603 length:642 start_codon:yes stop_codon:yes gene_type:complete